MANNSKALQPPTFLSANQQQAKQSTPDPRSRGLVGKSEHQYKAAQPSTSSNTNQHRAQQAKISHRFFHKPHR